METARADRSFTPILSTPPARPTLPNTPAAMMTRALPLLLAVALAVPASAQMRAADEARVSPNARIGTTVGTTEVDVTYGRPSLRDRSYFTDGSDLAPAGDVWRTGANEATTIAFSSDVMMNGERIPAGTYSLFTIPGDEWTVILNATPQQWGAYRYDAEQDVARFTALPMDNAPMQEQFEIRFQDVMEDSATMILHWGTVGVPVTITRAAM